ncbi:unnamed protein product [Closterium sp. Naga37s-1]|nr:unnamed protein product [Closterium sp. Naga37s-1]
MRPSPVRIRPPFVRMRPSPVRIRPPFVRMRPSPRPVHRQPSKQPATYSYVAPPRGEQRTHAGDVEYDPFRPADVAHDASLPRVLQEGSEGRGRELKVGVREMGGGGIGDAGREGDSGSEGRERRESKKRKFRSGGEEERLEKERRVDWEKRVDGATPLPPPSPLPPAPPLSPPAAASHPPLRPRPVIVWDLDETLIIFQSLLSEKFAKSLLADREAAGASGTAGDSGGRGVEERARELGEAWERLILDVCDAHFFFKELEDVDLPNLCHMEADSKPVDMAAPGCGDGSMPGPKQPPVFASSDVAADMTADVAGPHERQAIAERFQQIESAYRKGISSLLTPAQEAHRQQLYAQTDRFTHGWLAAGGWLQGGGREGGQVRFGLTFESTQKSTGWREGGQVRFGLTFESTQKSTGWREGGQVRFGLTFESTQKSTGWREGGQVRFGSNQNTRGTQQQRL